MPSNNPLKLTGAAVLVSRGMLFRGRPRLLSLIVQPGNPQLIEDSQNMSLPTLKAFILCDEVSDKPDSTDQKHLHGAGLARIAAAGPFPANLSFWAFIQMNDRKATGEARLALMRADSGRRYFFRAITVHHKNALEATVFCVRLYHCVFPEKGVYFPLFKKSYG
jgi:hypothetical protein